MAGLYVHIPFCKQACHYCNFHFSTSLKLKQNLLHALHIELQQRKDYLETKELDTIYLGGGTPSILEVDDIMRLFDQISQIFTWPTNAEITIEANPDDLSMEKIKSLKMTPVNRLSIGIQSFHDPELQFMNRSHDAELAHRSLFLAQSEGFDNITMDLIYGSPISSTSIWQENLEQMMQYGIPHFSCYALTVEPRTVLAHQVKMGKTHSPDDKLMAQYFTILMEFAKSNGYQHYEISNFAKPNRLAIHNRNYWLGKSYLGIGPSAHSYNGSSRSWNVSSNPEYIRSTVQGQRHFREEILSCMDRYNEYVMTRLRTMWGCDINEIRDISEAYASHFSKAVLKHLGTNLMKQDGSQHKLTNEGKFFADRIARDLFVI
ncbi:MAG: radical SAM family heme chaperone HemW [Saprospiraceae bacterium]|nr:radical SAM family heme chaperone HemW [Saprospiraceae bacterium]